MVAGSGWHVCRRGERPLEVGAAGDAKFVRYRAAAREAEKALGVPIVVKRKRGTFRL